MQKPIERRLILLGSTGSIGTQTLEVIEHLNTLADAGLSGVRFRIVGLAAGRNAKLLFEQARRFNVAELALGCEDWDRAEHHGAPAHAVLRTGLHAPEALVREIGCDVVLAAMVGSAGLPATLASVQLGRDVALANKETLVAAGHLIVPAARLSGSKLLPVDSEHCGLWQCLLSGQRAGTHAAATNSIVPGCADPASVRRLVLTASGGPFRTWSKADVLSAVPAQALKHPTWSMGQKVTIDSASLTNKALEIIEAHWLFNIPSSKIEAIVHPQSIVHALVEYHDGNTIAQFAPPDMRTPIQYALTYPDRPEGLSKKLDWQRLDWTKQGALEFFAPDTDKFPALKLAYRVIEAHEQGQTHSMLGAIFNAANEASVEAFLKHQIPFGEIYQLTRGAMDALANTSARTLDEVLLADAAARQWVREHLQCPASA